IISGGTAMNFGASGSLTVSGSVTAAMLANSGSGNNLTVSGAVVDSLTQNEGANNTVLIDDSIVSGTAGNYGLSGLLTVAQNVSDNAQLLNSGTGNQFAVRGNISDSVFANLGLSGTLTVDGAVTDSLAANDGTGNMLTVNNIIIGGTAMNFGTDGSLTVTGSVTAASLANNGANNNLTVGGAVINTLALNNGENNTLFIDNSFVSGTAGNFGLSGSLTVAQNVSGNTQLLNSGTGNRLAVRGDISDSAFANFGLGGTLTVDGAVLDSIAVNSGADNLLVLNGTASGLEAGNYGASGTFMLNDTVSDAVFYNDGTDNYAEWNGAATTVALINSGASGTARFTTTSAVARAEVTNSGTDGVLRFEGALASSTVANLGVNGAVTLAADSETDRSLIVNQSDGNTAFAAGIVRDSVLGNYAAGNVLDVSGTTHDSALFNQGAGNVITVGGVLATSTVFNAGVGNALYFTGSGRAAQSAVWNEAGNAVDISQHDNTATVGSLNSAGAVFLGGRTLEVGALGADDTIAGVISDGGLAGGVGGQLVKVGAGTLILTAVNTYTGDTEAREGTLFVNGEIQSPLTVVRPGATFGGTGLVRGDVFNNGTVFPGDDPGTLTVTGDYTSAEHASNLSVQIQPDIYSVLRVGGVATLSGTISIQPFNGAPVKPDLTKYHIIVADGGVSGQFDEMWVDDAIVRPNHVLYYGQETHLLLGAAEFHTVSGLSANQRSVAAAVNDIYNGALPLGNRGDFIDYVAALVDLASAQAAAVFDQTSPIGFAGMTEMSVATNDQLYGGLAGRLSGYRHGVNTQAGTGGGFLHKPDSDRWGAWLSGYGGFANMQGSGEQPGYRFNTAGSVIGTDYQARPDLLLGLLGAYVSGENTSANDAKINLDGGKLGLYATWWQRQTYVQAYTGAGLNRYATTRGIALPGFTQSQAHGADNDALGANSAQRYAKGAATGVEGNFALDAGHEWAFGNLRVGPALAVHYDYIAVDGFQEAGANALDLNVHDQSVHALRSLLGVRADYTWKLDPTLAVTPYASARWRHEYLNNGHVIGANFDGGDTFSVRTTAPARDSALINAGVNVELDQTAAIYLDYQGDVGRGDYDSHAIFGGIRLKF
ncbi:MAG: autotransporter domain-containing protein, partial [Verrucomicrobiales bacterium]|nr:autotransporter domain-containing protein [Verrucomicrobiales bacterium]